MNIFWLQSSVVLIDFQYGCHYLRWRLIWDSKLAFLHKVERQHPWSYSEMFWSSTIGLCYFIDESGIQRFCACITYWKIFFSVICCTKQPVIVIEWIWSKVNGSKKNVLFWESIVCVPIVSVPVFLSCSLKSTNQTQRKWTHWLELKPISSTAVTEWRQSRHRYGKI